MNDEITSINNRILTVANLLGNVEVKGIANMKLLCVSIEELDAIVKTLTEIQNDLQKGDDDHA